MITTELLKDFCEPEEGWRDAIKEPFTQGDHTFATDGIIILKLPRMAGVAENPMAPKCDAVMKQFPAADIEWFDIGAIPAKKPDPECEACDGNGQHLCKGCDCLHECAKCKGVGTINRIQMTPLGVRQMNIDVLSRISLLPGIKVAKEYGDPLSPLPIRFDGGIGLAMPCDPSKSPK